MSPMPSVLLVSLLFIGGVQLVHAADTKGVHPYLSDPFFVDVGFFWPYKKLELGADGDTGDIHELIEFDESTKLKRADDIFSVEFGWRFGEKWQLIGQYFESGSDKTWLLEEDIEWRDVVFQAGTNASSGAEFMLLRAFFARDFNVGERHEFGLGAGIHWLDISAHIEGTVLVEDTGVAYARESVGVSAPLPNIGAWYIYSISDRWALTSRADFFSADIRQYDGTMINFSLGANFQVARNFGLGLSYNYFHLDVGIDESNWNGRIETRFEGPYANLSFFW